MDAYRTQSDDTPAAVERLQLDAYRRMSPSQKLEIVFGLNALTDALARARLRQQYPTASADETAKRLAALKYPRDLLARCLGWDPEREGY